jgi:hypothetical protein
MHETRAFAINGMVECEKLLGDLAAVGSTLHPVWDCSLRAINASYRLGGPLHQSSTSEVGY